jgi:hypothetical protein
VESTAIPLEKEAELKSHIIVWNPVSGDWQRCMTERPVQWVSYEQDPSRNTILLDDQGSVYLTGYESEDGKPIGLSPGVLCDENNTGKSLLPLHCVVKQDHQLLTVLVQDELRIRLAHITLEETQSTLWTCIAQRWFLEAEVHRLKSLGSKELLIAGIDVWTDSDRGLLCTHDGNWVVFQGYPTVEIPKLQPIASGRFPFQSITSVVCVQGTAVILVATDTAIVVFEWDNESSWHELTQVPIANVLRVCTHPF